MNLLANHIEALLFAAKPSISLPEIKDAVEEVLETKFSDSEISEQLDEIAKKYNSGDYVLELVDMAGGYQFLTKAQYHSTVMAYLKQDNHKKLSTSAMETLAIIAYRQPVTKSTMEEIRGVSCDYAVSKLLDKELIEVVGRSEDVGKPNLYGTSQKFLDYFGLDNAQSLPRWQEVVNDTLPQVDTLER